MDHGVSVDGLQAAPTRALRGLIEVSRLTRSAGSLSTRLEQLARTIGDSLGYGTVVVTLYRPEWDDFRVASVSGRDEARSVLLGCTRSWDEYRPLLDESFLRRGAYVIPHGEFDWSQTGLRYTPQVEPLDEGPDAWHPEDVLIVPLNGSDGTLLGVMSVDEPATRRRPTDEDLDVLVTVAEHVALAIEDAQLSGAAARHRAALQHLLQVSSRLTETLRVDTILHSVCDAIANALGFEKVSIELASAHDDSFVPRASSGWGPAGPPRTGFTRSTIMPLLDPAYEVEGCFLLPLDVAEARIGSSMTAVYRSSLNGNGPRAWNQHVLIVPLIDREGAVEGFIWANDPSDRMLPAEEKLQALRLFANQATTALDSAARFEQMQFLADHDPLTRLANRRAFVRQLEAETARSSRYGNSFALVLCDLDGFKELNDRCGHLVGDDELVRFANRLTASVRRADFVYRVGGDEFALLLVESGEDQARHVVSRITDALAGESDPVIRASFGVAVYASGIDSQDLFRRADEAMYEAKRSDGHVAVAA
jgi:diguanylate cyclase (GGDEF)-like protein